MNSPPEFSKSRAVIFAISLALLAASGCVRKNDPDDEPNPAAAAPSQLPAGQVKLTPEQQSASGVSVGTAELKPMAEVLTTSAQIEVPTGRSAQVMPPVAGYVEVPSSGIPVIGSQVQRGRVMAVVRQAYSATDRLQLLVNPQDADAGVKTAQAQRTLAQAQLDRSRRLFQDKIAPLKQVQQDEAALQTAEVAYQNAVDRAGNYKAALSSNSPQGGAGPAQFVVAAPISGFVETAEVTPGQWVDPSRPLFSLVDTSTVWVKVPVPEAQLGMVGQSNSGELTASAYPGRVFRVRRVASSPVVDPSTHTATIIYEVANPRGDLKPGMVAAVRLVSSHIARTLAIPEAALVREPGETVVFLQIAPDRFQRQPVTVAFLNQGEAAIQSGVAPGQKLAISGSSMLESQLQKGRIQVNE